MDMREYIRDYTILQQAPYVHPEWSIGKHKIDSSSCRYSGYARVLLPGALGGVNPRKPPSM